MNLSELQAEIGRLLNDPLNQRWSTSVLTARINEAQTIVNGYTNAVKTLETLSPTASTSAVSLNANTMDIYRVDMQRTNGDIFVLEGISRETLDFDYPNWMNLDPGEPRVWWYSASDQTINLIPAPDSSNAISSGLRVWEIRKPASVGTSTDIPFDSNNQMVPYHMAIVHWVVAQCWMDDGTPEALAKARFHKSGVMDQRGAGQFEQQVMRIISKFDRPETVPEQINWRPTGGRVGAANYPTKGNPFAGL